ncbi:hypothetical protein CR969_02855 [Candidatus Saccharibacteria bacterium]|nr:MAG: hypothetical protein CR969_02855 [Candidatus Saccharibacteria bacterium]
MNRVKHIILVASSVLLLSLSVALLSYQSPARAADEQCVSSGTNLSNYNPVAAPLASGGYALDGQTVATNIAGLDITHSLSGDAPRNFHVYSDRGTPYAAFQGVTGDTLGPSTSSTTTYIYKFNKPTTNLEADLRDLDGNRYGSCPDKI